MNAPSLIATVLTVTAIGSTPAVASAAKSCPDGGSCRIALNHSETLVVAIAAWAPSPATER